MSVYNPWKLGFYCLAGAFVTGSVYHFLKVNSWNKFDRDVKFIEYDESDIIIFYLGDWNSYVGTIGNDNAYAIENYYVEVEPRDAPRFSLIGVDAVNYLEQKNRDESEKIVCVERGEELLTQSGHLHSFISEILRVRYDNLDNKIILYCHHSLDSMEKKDFIASHLARSGVAGFMFRDSAILSLSSFRYTTGIVIKSRENSVVVVPIFQNEVIAEGIRTLKIGRNFIYNEIQKEVQKQTVDFIHADIIGIMSSLVDFSSNFKNTSEKSIPYKLISGITVNLSKNALARITESFFNPDVNDEGNCIALIVKQTVDSSPTHGKKLLRNVVITGSLTQLKGFEERINEELREIVFQDPQLKYNHLVLAPDNREFLPWHGAQRLMQDSFKEALHQEIISTSSYLKHGHSCL